MLLVILNWLIAFPFYICTYIIFPSISSLPSHLSFLQPSSCLSPSLFPPKLFLLFLFLPLPSSRTPLKMPMGKGKLVWPTVADLNTRVRRLVSSFLKHQRQQQLKVEKQRKQQARKEKEWEASRQRQLKKEEMAQK